MGWPCYLSPKFTGRHPSGATGCLGGAHCHHWVSHQPAVAAQGWKNKFKQQWQLTRRYNWICKLQGVTQLPNVQPQKTSAWGQHQPGAWNFLAKNFSHYYRCIIKNYFFTTDIDQKSENPLSLQQVNYRPLYINHLGFTLCMALWIQIHVGYSLCHLGFKLMLPGTQSAKQLWRG